MDGQLKARRRANLAGRSALALTAILLAAGCGAGAGQTAPAGSIDGDVAWHGIEPQPVPDRPDFVLTDTDGKPYDFRAETAGRPTLVYFGYTNCPDECPTAMADIAAALRQTPADVRDEVVVLLVTTDPTRDTPEVLREWLDRFDTEFIGLVGTAPDIDAAQVAVGIQPATQGGPIPTLPGKPNEHVDKPGTAPHTHTGPLGYGVNHTDVIFAYSSDDRLPVVYPGGTLPSDIAADLPALVTKSGDS